MFEMINGSMQVHMPKIKLAPSGAKSHTLSPRLARTLRRDSNGKHSISTLKMEGLVESAHEPRHFFPNDPKDIIKPLPHIPSTLDNSNAVNINHFDKASVKRMPRSTRVSSYRGGEYQLEKKTLGHNRSGSSHVEELSSTVDKTKISQGSLFSRQKTLGRKESLTNRPVDNISYENEDARASKTGNENNDNLVKQKMQKITSSVAKAVANLDSLSDEQLIDLAGQILEKPPELRNVNDIKILAKCMSAVEFFKKYDINTTEACLKHMYYVSMKQSEKVFEIGTVGTNFWVILKGSVSVFVDLPKVVGRDENGENILAKVSTEVRVLPAGSAFGELALMNSKPRSATIICREECHFAVLEKDPFKEILNEKEKKNLAIHLEFLNSIPVLKTLPYHVVHWVYYNVEPTKCIRGQVIYEEGSASENIYIIKAGEFKIIKSIEEPEEAEPNMLKSAFEKIRRRQTTKKIVELAILGQKEIFGEEEVMATNYIKRKYTVVCNSAQAEIYEISKENLEKKMLTFDSMKEWLLNYIEGRENYYNERLKTIREARSDPKPLFPYHVEKPLSPKKQVQDLNSMEFSKHQDLSETGINPQYVKRLQEDETKLAAKKKAFLAARLPGPTRDPLKSSSEIQVLHNENKNFAHLKIGNPTKIKIPPKTKIEQPDSFSAKLSLMKVNLEHIKMKNRYVRRSESVSKKIDRSQRRGIEGSISARVGETSLKLRPCEDSFPNNAKDAYGINSSSREEYKVYPSSAFLKQTVSPLLGLPTFSGGIRKGDKEKFGNSIVSLKKIGNPLLADPPTIDGFRADLPPSLLENTYTSILYNKAVERMSWNMGSSSEKHLLSYPSQILQGPEDTEDIRTYLLAKLNSQARNTEQRNKTENSPRQGQGERLLSSPTSQQQSSAYYKGTERKSMNSRKDHKIPRKPEGEESPSRLNSNGDYTPRVRGLKKYL